MKDGPAKETARSAGPRPGPGPAAGPAPPSGAQSVERALSLLTLVGRSSAEGASLTEIVAASGLNKPTARRLLVALIRARLVEQDEATRRYHLGQEAFVLGTLAARRHSLLEHATDSLRQLAEVSGDTAFLSVRHGDYALCLHREEGSFEIRTHALNTGDQHPLGIGAGSLAMLAALPEAERDAVIERLADLYAARAGYSAEIIRADVALTLERGWSVNPGRVVASSWGIGMAVRLPDGRLAAALSLAAIDTRMTPGRQQELAALLATETRRLEDRLARLFGPPPLARKELPDGHRNRSLHRRLGP